MEIVEFSLSPVIIPAKPWIRTKPAVIKVDKSIHCRVCTRKAGKAVSHDENTLHKDTVESDNLITKAVTIHRENKG